MFRSPLCCRFVTSATHNRRDRIAALRLPMAGLPRAGEGGPAVGVRVADVEIPAASHGVVELRDGLPEPGCARVALCIYLHFRQVGLSRCGFPHAHADVDFVVPCLPCVVRAPSPTPIVLTRPCLVALLVAVSAV